jgi:hypothetical protein
VTASLVQPETAAPRGPGAGVALAVGLFAAVTVLVLFVAGMTFIGLAIAFPIAVPIAEAYHVPISPADAGLAERFAAVWWAFAALAIASFAAAGVLVVKVIGYLSPTSRD